MGFSPHTETLLTRAGSICESRGTRLTDLRRQVLGLILDSGAPTGAYDLLDRLKTTRHGAAPPTVYRALDAIIGLQEKGVDAGLVNKATLNVVDASMMQTLAKAPWVLVVEGWNVKTGLGSRFGSYLLQYGFKGKYDHLGTHLEGSGGLWQQMGYQGLDPAGISAAITRLSAAR